MKRQLLMRTPHEFIKETGLPAVFYAALFTVWSHDHEAYIQSAVYDECSNSLDLTFTCDPEKATSWRESMSLHVMEYFRSHGHNFTKVPMRVTGIDNDGSLN